MTQPNQRQAPAAAGAPDLSYFDDLPDILDLPDISMTPTSECAQFSTGKTPQCIQPHERPTWNCFRCDQCGLTNKLPGPLTNHIKGRNDHDPWTVGASWVGDANVKAARGFISGEPIMVRLQRLERQCEQRKGTGWNCYRCDQCGFTHEKPGPITNHIKDKDDHDPWTVGASWVGNENAKAARGFISGEPIMVRLKRLTRERKERLVHKKEAKEDLEEDRKKRKAKEALGDERQNEITRYRKAKAWIQYHGPTN